MRIQIYSTPAAALVFTAALSLTSCHSGSANHDAASIPSARVAVAQHGDISHVLTLAGQFQPYQVVDVHPKD